MTKNSRFSQWSKFVLLLFVLSMFLSACTPKASEKTTIKFAVLPILDSLPMYVAQQEGLFEKYNLDVELVPISSGPERDQLIAANQIDGMINEVLTTILNNRTNKNVVIVRYARAATADTPLFSIVASAKSGITSVDQLKGVKIGISEGTVIAYLTDRMLQKEGFAQDDIVTVAVPKIPDRVTLISNGELDAGTMPEPVASLLALQGATVVLADNKYPEYSHSTIAFRNEFVESDPDAVKAFLAAIEEAVETINADPTKWEATLVENNILPVPLQGKFQVPSFVTAGVPSPEQFADVLSWAQEKELISDEVPYERCISSEYLP
ncbi:MAG: ABC transporter substrate-binding protein [Anaerolineaceae bacterium]|nr:ABC transporter substrate-binding protein [Anaerolineaceae bacterium]